MSLFNKFKIGLGKSSSGLTDGFKNIFSKKNINEDVLTKFEELIISADAGVDVARELRKDFENFKIDKKLDDHKEILKLIAEKMALENLVNTLRIIIDQSYLVLQTHLELLLLINYKFGLLKLKLISSNLK